MNVKVNRVRGGSMGDQRNYGLVTGSIWNYEDKPSTNEVSDTLGAVDRDQATIEAERGETVIYPDKDGQITHAKIGGKRHTHGGTPLDIPDGAFVFSDTRALLIKNKELLKNIFGMNSKKAVTPAKVAQRYDLNQYNEILNDPESDFLSKKTAQLMLDNNMKKLGQLALVQEGMKGFPDGIPDIALPLFGSDIAVAQPMQEMPQAKFGGQIMRRGGKKLPKHQDYGEVFSSESGYRLPEVLVEEFYPEWQQYIQRGLVDPNALPDEDESIKRQQVANAIKIYNDALKSGDVKAMKNASDALFKMDIEGFSTPGPWLSKGWKNFQQGLGNLMFDVVSPVFKEFNTPLEDIPATDMYINMRGAAQRAERALAQRAPSGAWTWQDKIYEMGRMLENFIEDKEKMSATSSNAKNLLPKIEEYGKKKDEVVSKAEEILKNPEAYSPDLVYKAGEFISEYKGEDFWRGLLRDEKSFFEAPLKPAENLNLHQLNPETWNSLYSKPVGIIKKAYDDLVDTKAIKTEQQRQEQENAGTQSNKESLNQWISGIKSGKYSVNEVPRDLLPDLEAAGIDISGAGNPAPTRSSSSSRSTQQRATTAPSKTEESDETIRQRLISIGIDPNDITPEMIQQNKYAKGGMTYVYDPTNNIMLDKYQTKGGVKAFNIYDKNFRDYANQNKLKLVLPSWATGMMSIGEQNPSKDPRFKKSATGEIIPSAGISGYTGPDDLIKWHKSQGMDFSKYVDADGNTAKDETDGMTKFKNDLKTWDNSGKKHRHATSWMLGKVDEINTERATKLGLAAPPSQTDKGTTGWDVTGFDVLTGTKYLAPEDTPVDDVPPVQPPVETPPVNTPPADVPTPKYTAGYPGGWTDYSTLNLATAMGMANQVEPGALPPFTQAFPDLGRPVFMDPRANIMNQLALQNQQAEMIAGMSSPTVGRANIIASAAKTAEPISDIMAKYDQANATIANTYEGQRAAISNQAQMTSAAKREEFQDELAVRRQNYLNALKESQANVAYQYERGAKDFREKNALNVQNPNYMFDNYGNIMFKPGYNPNATASSSADDLLDNYINKGIDPNKAAALVAAQMKLNDNAFNYDPMSTVWGSQKPVS